MRFLLLSHVAPPHIGGVENLVLAEANALVAAGHEVVWLTSDASGHGHVPAPHPRLRIERVPAWHGIERRFGVAYPLFSLRLLRRLWREVCSADVVHAHGLVFVASPLAMVFARCAGKWALCTDHGGLLRYRSRLATFALRVLFATAGRLTATAAHRVIAYNADVEKLLRRLAGDPAKVRFVANAIDTTLFVPPSPQQRGEARAALGWDDKPRVLCVARLLPHKGIDVLLAAQDQRFELVFCGPGTDAMRAHIRTHGAVCLEPRPQAEVAALYQAADVFALPSRNEGFPVAIQEALACGLPVITSDLPAYAPYRDLQGLHVCEPSAPELRERLLAILGEPRAPARERTVHAPPDGGAAWLEFLLPPEGRLTPRARGLALAAVLLLALHVLFGAARWPFGAVAKRAASIAEYEAMGPAGWYLRHYDDETRRIAAWLVREVPANECVLVRGWRQGAMQLLAPLLHPRLLVDVEQLAARTPPAPVFAGGAGANGVPVVAGDGQGLRLEWR